MEGCRQAIRPQAQRHLTFPRSAVTSHRKTPPAETQSSTKELSLFRSTGFSLQARVRFRLVFDTDSSSWTGIDAKDIEEQPQANLDVFGVYAVIRQCWDSHKKNRLGMLGVIGTEHTNRCCFPR